jgi:hypothetical protein
MKRYLVWVRINAWQTAHTVVYADNDWMAKLVAESQYGVGNVLNWTEEKGNE